MATIEGQKVTIGLLMKLVSAVVFVVGYTVSVYAWVNNIDSKVELIRQEQCLLHKQLEGQLQIVLTEQQETRKVQAELLRALDKTQVILENLNKKLEVK